MAVCSAISERVLDPVTSAAVHPIVGSAALHRLDLLGPLLNVVSSLAQSLLELFRKLSGSFEGVTFWFLSHCHDNANRSNPGLLVMQLTEH